MHIPLIKVRAVYVISAKLHFNVFFWAFRRPIVFDAFI